MEGVVWRDMNEQVLQHLELYSILLPSSPTSDEPSPDHPDDQHEFQTSGWQLLMLRTHHHQTVRQYHAAARIAVDNFTYTNLAKESGQRRMANPRDSSQPLLVLGEQIVSSSRGADGSIHSIYFTAAPRWGNLELPISGFFMPEQQIPVYDLPHPCFPLRLIRHYVMGHMEEMPTCLPRCPGSSQSPADGEGRSSSMTTHFNLVCIFIFNPVLTDRQLFHLQDGRCSTRRRSDSTLLVSGILVVITKS